MLSDPDLHEMAAEELQSLAAQIAEAEQQLRILLLPRDPDDDHSIIMEIRGGAGGEESCLFAAELMRMYIRYAERHHFRVEPISTTETELGGIKEAVFSIAGSGVFARMKYESGVHRVQRVPITESNGKIQSSTCTVAVLPEAVYAGLDLAIMNPSSEEMMAAVYAYNVLTNRDRQSTKYIERYANRVPASAALVQAVQNAQTAPAAGETPEAAGPYAPLMKAVEKGLKGEAAARTRALLEEKEPLELVDEALIPALDIVGAKYEKGTLFLPQLLQAATAAQGAFEEIKTAIAQKGEGSASKGRIVIATVKGDVHDIGKNIVRVILENYGFEVIDLGRDVPVETVVNTVREKDVHLVGLSALMTTTLKSMEETIRALHDAKLDCKIMVGGAVLTPEYAKKIGADWYAKDAKQSADIAKEFFGV